MIILSETTAIYVNDGKGGTFVRMMTPLTNQPVWYGWGKGGWLLEDGQTQRLEPQYQELIALKGKGVKS